MSSEEEDFDFEVLSKEYPLFFSPANQELYKKVCKSHKKSKKKKNNEPQLFLDYEDYMLDVNISKLSPYPIRGKIPKTDLESLQKLAEPKEQQNNTDQKSKSTTINKDETPHKVSPLDISSSKAETMSNSPFKEKGIQTPNRLMRKKFKVAPTTPPSLHSDYQINFDYEPRFPQRKQTLNNGTEKVFYANGDVSTHFKNGMVKIRHGNITTTKFKNGDILEEFPDGANAYKYAKSGTIELKLPDGTSIIEFSNGQREKRTPDGVTTVNFGTGVFMKVDSDGNWTMINSKTHKV